MISFSFRINKKLYSVLLIATIVVCNACIEKKPLDNTDQKKLLNSYIFYPSLPNDPKFQFLTQFTSSEDLKKNDNHFKKFILGEDAEKPIVIKRPYGITMAKGIIYVCDMPNSAVVTINLNNNVMEYKGISQPGNLVQPCGIFYYKELNHIFVSDISRKQVLEYDLNMQYIKSYGKKGELLNPIDVDVYDNKIYVCDSKKNEIIVFDLNSGNIIKTIGESGSDEGQLYHPNSIQIFKDKLFVSETTNFRFQIFDLEGEYINMYGELGNGLGNFSRPKGLAVDKYENIFVTDSAFENIQIFNKDFQYLMFFCKPGALKGDINLPYSLYINYDDISFFKEFISPNFKAEYLLFVTSHFGNGKINVYAFGKYDKTN